MKKLEKELNSTNRSAFEHIDVFGVMQSLRDIGIDAPAEVTRKLLNKIEKARKIYEAVDYSITRKQGEANFDIYLSYGIYELHYRGIKYDRNNDLSSLPKEIAFEMLIGILSDERDLPLEEYLNRYVSDCSDEGIREGIMLYGESKEAIEWFRNVFNGWGNVSILQHWIEYFV